MVCGVFCVCACILLLRLSVFVFQTKYLFCLLMLMACIVEARVCICHVASGELPRDLVVARIADLQEQEIPFHLLQQLLCSVNNSTSSLCPPSVDFDKLDSACCYKLTGFHRDQLEYLAGELNLKNSSQWSALNSIGIFFNAIEDK